VVAGQPLWLDGGAGGRPGRPGRPILAATDPAAVPPMPDLEALPQPHAAAGKAVATRLAGSGLGALVAAVSFAAAAQGSATPRPWESVRLFILSGDHPGAAAAGAASGADRSAALRAGAGALALLADHAATTPQMVECAPAAPIEHGAAATSDAVEQAFARGYAIADRAVDEGADVLALGSLGDGADTAAAAVTSLLGGNAAEPAGLLGRVRAADGTFDDAAWIRRCAAVRDAVRRVRRGGSGGSGAAENRPAARTVLAELGGADIATATGVILGAAARRTPVLLDGPVGAAAALAARGLATPAGQWCLLVDHGGHPTAVHAADQLRLTPLLDLRLDLGEGAAVLAALPLLRLATALAATALAATALSESTPARTEA
jgi:NaMN:DMB phosphoribosyltransferase